MKDWLLLNDIRNDRFDKHTWITILAYIPQNNSIDLGNEGYTQQYDCVKSVMVKTSMLKHLNELPLSSIWQSGNHQPSAYKGNYTTLESFNDYHSNITGEYLAFERIHPYSRDHDIQISNDLIFALDLFKIGNFYCNPHEDNDKVIIINNLPNDGYIVQVKREYLLDYLSARNMHLIIDRYYERQFDTKDSYFDNNVFDSGNYFSYELRFSPILADGNSPGTSTMVMKAAYKDAKYDSDVPIFTRGENIEVESKEIKHDGESINHYFAEFRKYYILMNDKTSIRVRWDKTKITEKFFVDNTNRKVLSEKLMEKIQYLWFKPDIMKLLQSGSYCSLEWYTKNTGRIGNIENSVWFGVNGIGLINVFAKDIVELSDYYRSKWAAFNCAPNGGVSSELLMSQIEANPARTIAAEKLLKIAVNEFEVVMNEKLNGKIFKDVSDIDKLAKLINRFQSVSKDDCFTLCKNINRFIIERFDIGLLTSHTTEMPKGTGSLKRLEKLLNSLDSTGSVLISPLFVIYDIRIIDSHNIGGDVDANFLRLGVKITGSEDNFVSIGAYIIFLVAKTLHDISIIFKEKNA